MRPVAANVGRGLIFLLSTSRPLDTTGGTLRWTPVEKHCVRASDL